jgi:hypothetical protein
MPIACWLTGRLAKLTPVLMSGPLGLLLRAGRQNVQLLLSLPGNGACMRIKKKNVKLLMQ